MLYLDYDDWSPRYDPDSFYTIQLQGYVWIASQEQLYVNIQQEKNHPKGKVEEPKQGESVVRNNNNNNNNSSNNTTTSDHIIKHQTLKMPVNNRFPTYYYKIIVYRGHYQHVLYRSYIQFMWLYQQLRQYNIIESNISSATTTTTTTKVSDEQIRNIPHPLRGNIDDDDDKCQNLMGYCWIVQQVQEFFDYIKQQQHHHHNQQPKQHTMTPTNTLDHKNDTKYKSSFAESRCQQLSYFITTTLEQHGRLSTVAKTSSHHSSHSNVIRQFLEL